MLSFSEHLKKMHQIQLIYQHFYSWQHGLYFISCTLMVFSCCCWFNQGDFTWSSLSGRSVRLTPVDIQSLSELERARLQEVAFTRLHQDYDLGCQITMPKGERTRALYAEFNTVTQFLMSVSFRRVGFTAAAVEPWLFLTFNSGKTHLWPTLELWQNDARLAFCFMQLLSSVL